MKTRKLLEHFPVIVSLPLQWGEQDPLSHVNNVVYFRWAETARIAYLTQANAWDGSATVEAGPILAAIPAISVFHSPIRTPFRLAPV